MNLERKSALELVSALRDRIGNRTDVDVAVFPPFVYIDEISRVLSGSPIKVGAQNCCDEASGAFTGEVSAAHLKDVGAEVVVLGHSERRHVYGESDELINAKVLHALATGLEVILCVGETMEEREQKQTETVVKRQLSGGLTNVAPDDLARVTIAYEPVWAIGTGLTATPEQAQSVHSYLRGLILGLYDEAAASAMRIQYGGSVKAANVAELMACPDIDGALVGGASLTADQFMPIVEFESSGSQVG